MRRTALILLAALVAWNLFPFPAYAGQYPQVMFILDGSGSMWAQSEESTKIEVAREVMSRIVPALPPEVETGLTSYGHRRKGDCGDIEIISPVGATDRGELLDSINKINPKGKTPIAAAVALVTEALRSSESETTVILVSDGEETCHDDPCGAVRAMREAGVRFVLHVVGFGVTDKEREQLACLAEAGGGSYFGADNAGALLAAFDTISAEVTAKVEKAKSVTVKSKSGLGRLHLTIPAVGLVSIASFTITRVRDGKVVKTTENPGADSTHPLPAGEYALSLGFGNVNYRDPSAASLGTWMVNGGETTDVFLGTVTLDAAEPFTADGAVYGVELRSSGGGESYVAIFAWDGNSYYVYRPKPAPAGTYDLAVHYAESPEPAAVAAGIEVVAGKDTTVTLDSGIALSPKEGMGVTGWDLIPSGSEKASLMVRRRFDNEYPLWQNFLVQPGTYDIRVHLDGMDEPLAVGEGIEVAPGSLVVFDTGL